MRGRRERRIESEWKRKREMELRKRILRGGKGEKEREKERRIRGETERVRELLAANYYRFSPRGMPWDRLNLP